MLGARGERKIRYSSLSNAHLRVLRALQTKKQRRKEAKFLLEGLRLCEEAFACRWVEPQELIIDPKRLASDQRFLALVDIAERKRIPLFFSEADIFHQFCDTQHPQGIACVVRSILPRLDEYIIKATGVWLAIDSLRDPGNLGTILRTAAWFGVSGVLLSPSTVDSTSPKVVRSSMGGLFHLPVFADTDLLHWLPRFREQGFRITAAMTTGGIDPGGIQAADRELILVGSEAAGLDLRLASEIDLRLTISRIGRGESLNAAQAAAILLYIHSQRK
ncbi:RNA methyltransferase [candidate division KSB1 bacterium]|nr:RNA methyltransferase [candidate division KSB1 bacterium]